LVLCLPNSKVESLMHPYLSTNEQQMITVKTY